MDILENSKVIPFEVIPPTEEELSNLYIPSQYRHIIGTITKLEGKFYCFKESLDFGLTNELIGSYLAKMLGLDTVDYEIGQRGEEELFALSKVFYEEGFQYQSVDDFLQKNHYQDCFSLSEGKFPIYWNMKTLNLYRGTPFYNSNLKLIAVDLKMAQYDRHSRNLQIKIDPLGKIDLAPIYDYGGSYINFLTPTYANPFACMKKNKATFEWLFTLYPELWEYVQILRGISITEILESIAQERKIEFTDLEYSSYRSLQQANDEIINKIKVKTIF